MAENSMDDDQRERAAKAMNPWFKSELAEKLCNGDPCFPRPCHIRDERSCLCFRAGAEIERLTAKLREVEQERDVLTTATPTPPPSA